MSTLLLILSLIGLLISVYTLATERKLAKNKYYKPLCDINDKISCTKNFKSSDAKIFFIPNSLLGIFFFIIITVFTFFNYYNYIFYLSIPAFLFNIYLAYASHIKLKNFCLVCTFTYLIVISILIISYLKI